MDLYFETYSGIAGDMAIGALLDLGIDKQILIDALSSMDFGHYDLVFERKQKNGIDAFNFDVLLDDHHHDHDHDHEHEHHHDHDHDHEHEHHHDHDHDHEHHNHDHDHEHEHEHEHHHHHEHRNLESIIKIIDSGNFSEKAKENAKKVFQIIGKAESKAHGVDINEVHFHEVGAVDSIIDIVGFCVLIDHLKPEHIYFSELYEGRGYVKCAHGTMPVPAPAVLNIIQDNNLPLNIIDDMGEHITPTGAAIVACFSEGLPPNGFKIKNTGIGAGNKDFANTTNIIRVMEIENSKKKH